MYRIDDRVGTPGRNLRYSPGLLRFLDIMGTVLACASKCLVPVLLEQVRILHTFPTRTHEILPYFWVSTRWVSLGPSCPCTRIPYTHEVSFVCMNPISSASTHSVRYRFMVFWYFLARSRFSGHVLVMSFFSECSRVRVRAAGTSLGILRVVPV